MLITFDSLQAASVKRIWEENENQIISLYVGILLQCYVKMKSPRKHMLKPNSLKNK